MFGTGADPPSARTLDAVLFHDRACAYDASDDVRRRVRRDFLALLQVRSSERRVRRFDSIRFDSIRLDWIGLDWIGVGDAPCVYFSYVYID